ncbi:MAG: B12-binding domain-containing radical SAM protein [Desulfonatronovibrio sp.]
MRQKKPSITWKPSGKSGNPRVLGINPWVYDFAAYNVWSRPAGLLTCLDMFARSGSDTALLDLMDKELSLSGWPAAKDSGKGPYPKTALPKPLVLKDVPRKFSRYGLSRSSALSALSQLSPGPDLILITSLMTYWYPGVVSAIRLARNMFPRARICLGGIYATLCFEHAAGLGADLVVSGPLERPDNWSAVWGLLERTPPALPENSGLIVDTSYYHEPDFSVLMCSRGCPFNCPYCASSRLYPDFRQVDPEIIKAHIQKEHQRGIRDFCFYDDALLVNSEKILYPVLEYIIDNMPGLRLHAPNALHIRYLTPGTCALLKKAGLTTVRLGLETSDFAGRRDTKLSLKEWRDGIASLLQAGFAGEDIVVYVLAGLPDQTREEVDQTVQECIRTGIRPELNYYSPIPGTPLFARAREVSPYPLEEPLFQNNSVWPCIENGFSWDEHKARKMMITNEHGRR